MPAVRARGLVKHFETVRALDHVSLELAEGEVRGLLGPNGAGKTTLLRILFGLVRADEGSVELFDRPLDAGNPESLSGVAGFVEDPTFYPYLSGRVNLELLAELDGDGGAKRIDQVLDAVELGGRGSQRVNGYSTGMRQRLGIAAALLRGPRALLLDEPTAGLDPAGVRDVGALLRRLSDQGVAVLISSHQIDEIEDVCDSFTVLSRGRVVWDGSAASMRAQAVGSAYTLATSDDRKAAEIGDGQPGIEVHRGLGDELEVAVEHGALDAFVLALGRAGVAVRLLELRTSPLEAMFFALTGEHQEQLAVSREEPSASGVIV